MICLIGCGSPCDYFADKFCTFANACGSILTHENCLLQVRQWMKENARLVEPQKCSDAMQKLDSATCSSTFGAGKVSSPGYRPAP